MPNLHGTDAATHARSASGGLHDRGHAVLCSTRSYLRLDYRCVVTSQALHMPRLALLPANEKVALALATCKHESGCCPAYANSCIR